MKKCPNCGACKECGAHPPQVAPMPYPVYPYVPYKPQPWVSPWQIQPARWTYTSGGNSQASSGSNYLNFQ